MAKQVLGLVGFKIKHKKIFTDAKFFKNGGGLDIHKIQVRENQYSRQSIGEVFKYAIKFGKLETPQFAEIMYLQHKHQYRFFASYGIFRGRKLESTKEFHGERSEGVFLYDEEEGKYEKV